MIAASRNFVCVRLNSYLDRRNATRLRGLIGRNQNTAFALIPPDAVNMKADSFPVRSDCFYGPDRTQPDEGGGPENLVVPMNELAAKYPVRESSKAEPPLFPTLPDVRQGLNFASCDSRALIVEVLPEDPGELELRTRALLWSADFVGRIHAVRTTPEEWARLREEKVVEGATLESGVFVITPEPYGRTGKVMAQAAHDADSEELRKRLHEGMHGFVKEFKKPHRGKHIRDGIAQDLHWKEFVTGADFRREVDEELKKRAGGTEEN